MSYVKSIELEDIYIGNNDLFYPVKARAVIYFEKDIYILDELGLRSNSLHHLDELSALKMICEFDTNVKREVEDKLCEAYCYEIRKLLYDNPFDIRDVISLNLYLLRKLKRITFFRSFIKLGITPLKLWQLETEGIDVEELNDYKNSISNLYDIPITNIASLSFFYETKLNVFEPIKKVLKWKERRKVLGWLKYLKLW